MKIKPIVPFEPTNTDKMPTGKQWVGQIKWDGTRVLTYSDGTHTRLFNRRSNERTIQYPELTDIGSFCSAKSVILDGEVIALENGKPSFHAVMKRDSLRKEQSIQFTKNLVPITYMIFDILFYNEEWITDKSLKHRQSVLERIINPNLNVQIVPSFSDTSNLFEVVKDYNLEGIVCKDLNSTYEINGKDKRWQKLKLIKDLVAVVGGVTHRAGTVNSLLLGLYDLEERLWYIGHAGTGKLSQDDWRSLTEKTSALRIETMPFTNVPERRKNTMWIEPNITVKINFMEWTLNKTLRQPSIQGFVEFPPHDCKFLDD